MRITEAQHVAACTIAAQVYAKEIRAADGIRVLDGTYGINKNSAKDFIDDYRYLAEGQEFQRAMSGAAMRHFLAQVALNEGVAGKTNAIKALRAHIKYYEGRRGHTMHMMRSVLAEFEESHAQTDESAEMAIAEISSVIEPLAHDGQSFGKSAEERKLVELKAMEVAKVELLKLGFTNITDVSTTQSFDYRAMIDDEEWLVEVKGTTNSQANQILLTANEVALHQLHVERSCLVVVAGIVLDRQAMIASGGTPIVFKPWGTAGWNLVPIAYKAVRIESR
jgi:hypothetical protein